MADQTVGGLFNRVNQIQILGSSVPTPIEERLRAGAEHHNRTEKEKYRNIFPTSGIEPTLIAKLKRLNGDSVVGEEMSIHQVLAEEKFCYVIGEGGMGKSTSLLHLLEEVVGGSGVYYLFALNSLNANAGEIISSSKVIDKIVRDLTFGKDKLSWEDELEDYLQDSKSPPFVLLLDGLNEVADSVHDHVTSAIKVLCELDRVHIVLTSRRSMEVGKLKGFVAFQQMPINEEIVLEFIHRNNFELAMQLEQKTKSNSDLLALLCNPMMLTLQCGQGTTCKIPAPTCKADILTNYFFRELDQKECDQPVVAFLINVFFPFVAHLMCIQEVFGLEKKELLKEFGKAKSFFCATYYEGLEDFYTADDSAYMLVEYVEELKQSCVLTQQSIGLVASGTAKLYKFSHQHFRDYMAAQWFRLYLQLFVDQSDGNAIVELLNKPIKISDDILRFLAEICEEGNRVPGIDGTYNKKTETLIEQCLELLRGQFGEEEAKAVSILVRICLLGRKGNLYGMNFSCMDLSNTFLNGCMLDDNNSTTGYSRLERRCSQSGIEGRPISTCFNGAKLSDRNLLPQGHNSSIEALLIELHPELPSDCVYSFGSDGITYHDMNNNATVFSPYKISGNVERIKSACDTGVNQITTIDKNNNEVVWKINEKHEAIPIKETKVASTNPYARSYHTRAFLPLMINVGEETLKDFHKMGELDVFVAAIELHDDAIGNRHYLFWSDKKNIYPLWYVDSNRFFLHISGVNRINDMDGIYRFLVTACNGCFYQHIIRIDKNGIPIVDSEPSKFVGHNPELKDVHVAEYIKYKGKTAIVSAAVDRSMKIWDPNNTWLIDDFPGHYSGLRTFRKIRNLPGLYVAAQYDGKISVWKDDESEGLVCLCSLSGHTDWVWSADAFYDSDTGAIYAISGAQDHCIKAWNLRCGQEITIEGILPHSGRVESVCFEDDGKHFLTCGADKRVLRHEIVFSKPDHWNCVSCVISPKEGKKGGHSKAVKSVTISEDGQNIYTGGADHHIQCDSLDHGRIASYSFKGGWARSVCLNKSGSLLISAGMEWEDMVDDRNDHENMIKAKENTVLTDEEINDRMSMIVASYEYICRGAYIWSVSDDKLVYKLSCHKQGRSEPQKYVNYAVFSPDEKYALVCSDFESILIFSMPDVLEGDCQTLEPLICLRATNRLFHIEFSHDGRYFFVTSLDGSIFRFDFPSIMEYNMSTMNRAQTETTTIDLTTAKQKRLVLVSSNTSRFLFHGCSFKNLHSESFLSAEVKRQLKIFRCEVDD